MPEKTINQELKKNRLNRLKKNRQKKLFNWRNKSK